MLLVDEVRASGFGNVTVNLQTCQRAAATAQFSITSPAPMSSSAAAVLLFSSWCAAAAEAVAAEETGPDVVTPVLDAFPRPGKGRRSANFRRVGGILQQRVNDRVTLYDLLSGDASYITHLRMQKNTFATLVGILRSDPVFSTDSTNNEAWASFGLAPKQQKPVEEQVFVALHFFATGHTYRQVAVSLGIPCGTLKRYVDRVTTALKNVGETYVRFPETEEEFARIARDFDEIHHLPSCVGILDGTRINILNRGRNNAPYMNTHYGTNIGAQILCDAHGRIQMAACGFPGRMHDSSMFKNTSLYHRRGYLLSHGYYILADAGYPLTGWCMTPFKDSEAEHHPRRKQYNKFLCGRRCLIERVIGHMKGRWKVISGTSPVRSLERLIGYFHACCVLHNFCLSMNDILVISAEPVHQGEVLAGPETVDLTEEQFALQLRATLIDLFNSPTYILLADMLKGSGGSAI